jgi:uncharacterized protein
MRSDARPDASYWISQLDLQFHPEGGYFKETFRSTDVLAGDALGSRYAGARAASTAIYFLVTADRPSRFHRLQTDEIWHFYAGDALEICCIGADGALEIKTLGLSLGEGQSPQLLIPAGTWFGARVQHGGSYTLCGCTMAPGFDFADFELADRGTLQAAFPEHQAIIESLTS